MDDDTERQELMQVFKQQYPEYRDVELQVTPAHDGRSYAISPINNLAFSVRYWSEKTVEDKDIT